MGLDNFMENLDNKHQEDKENLVFIKQEKERKKMGDDAFLEKFAVYYAKDLSRIFHSIKKTLSSKFLWEEKAGLLPVQYNCFQISITLTPNFECRTDMVIIKITANAKSRLVQFVGSLPENMGLQSRVALNYFELSYDDFTLVAMDEEFEKTLEKAFIK